jgi:hypothetical protein
MCLYQTDMALQDLTPESPDAEKALESTDRRRHGGLCVACIIVVLDDALRFL